MQNIFLCDKTKHFLEPKQRLASRSISKFLFYHRFPTLHPIKCGERSPRHKRTNDFIQTNCSQVLVAGIGSRHRRRPNAKALNRNRKPASEEPKNPPGFFWLWPGNYGWSRVMRAVDLPFPGVGRSYRKKLEPMWAHIWMQLPKCFGVSNCTRVSV